MSTARIVNPPKPAATLALTAEELDQADTGIGDVITLMSDAGETFDYLATALTCGWLDGNDASLAAIPRMSARAMNSAEGREFEALGLIEMKLRDGRIVASGEVSA